MYKSFKILGQTLTELAMFLSVVTLAIAGMQVYVQRSLQARYKTSVGYLFTKIEQEANVRSPLQQYEPYYEEWQINEMRKNQGEGSFSSHLPGRTIITQDAKRWGWQKISPTAQVN